MVIEQKDVGVQKKKKRILNCNLKNQLKIDYAQKFKTQNYKHLRRKHKKNFMMLA